VADPAGPNAILRLEVDQHGQLFMLNLAMDTCRGDGGTSPWEYVRPAAGYTELAEVETWHPVHVGPGHTVAEVLVQLPDHVCKQTVGVQFLDLVETGLNPTQPTPENGYLTGWAVYRTLLYRRSTPLTFDVEQPFALLDSAFDETGVAQLILQGGRYGGWKVSAQVFHPRENRVGDVIGSIFTEEARHPGAEDDAIEAARQWITDALPAETTVGFFKNLNRERFGSTDERGYFAGAHMILLRSDPRNA